VSKFNHVQTNFNNGEISDRALGRIDAQEYARGLRLCENFLPLITGGVTKRPGTIFFKELDKRGASPAIFPFEDSRKERYIVIIEEASIVPLSTGNIRVVKVSDRTVINDTAFPIANSRAGKWTFLNVGDTMLFCHSDGLQVPFSLRFVSDTFVTIQTIFFPFFDESIPQIDSFLRVPYLDRNITGTSFTFSGTTGVITVTSSIAIFNASMNDTTFFKVVHGVTEGVFAVNTVTSGNTATCTVLVDLGATSASTNWAESAWSGDKGYPKTMAYFEQRIFYANTKTEPGKFWGSLAGNPFLFMQERLLQDQGSATDVSGSFYFGDISENDPIAYRIGSTKTQFITWLNSQRVLNVGSNAGEYVATGHDRILSPLSISVSRQTSYGGKPFRTETIGDEVIYITNDGRRVRSFGFSINNGSNISLDLNLLSDHMYRGNDDSNIDQFRDAMYSSSRDCLWLLTENNSLLGLSYSKENGLLSWHRHRISEFNGESKVESFCVLNTEEIDKVFLMFERADKFVLETIGDDFFYPSLGLDFSETFPNPVNFLDAAFITSFPATGSTITLAPDYFKNTTVTVTKNGFVIGDFPVDGAGLVDISPSVGIMNVDIFAFGYKYTSTIETVDIEAGGDFGFSEGSIQRIDRVTVKCFRTFDLSVGVVNGQIDPISFGSNVFTGSKRINLAQNPDETVRVLLESKQPYPCTILSLAMRGVSYD